MGAAENTFHPLKVEDESITKTISTALVNAMGEDLKLISNLDTLVQDERLIHPSAHISPLAYIGSSVQIHAGTQIGERTTIGENSIVDMQCYIDHDVIVGANVHVQNGVSICQGVMIESGVFIGSNVTFTNYRYPRAIYFNGAPKPDELNEIDCILVRYGSTISAGAVILPGVRIGIFAMVGAGAVVSEDVPAYGLVLGNPARLTGFACHCGKPMRISAHYQDKATWLCELCNFTLNNLPIL
ncbi:hypothetical protein [Candidatus Chlorohelix sp.]|uniref:acyltransferase n=1 Tax=Candidatus Chlorohelix sp. TaxID=3139201 RepID=UPI003038F625